MGVPTIHKYQIPEGLEDLKTQWGFELTCYTIVMVVENSL